MLARRSFSFHRVRAHAAKALLAAGAVVIASLPSMAQAQTVPLCGPEVKDEVATLLASATTAAAQSALEKELYAKYVFCAQDSQNRYRRRSRPLRASAAPRSQTLAAPSSRK